MVGMREHNSFGVAEASVSSRRSAEQPNVSYARALEAGGSRS